MKELSHTATGEAFLLPTPDAKSLILSHQAAMGMLFISGKMNRLQNIIGFIVENSEYHQPTTNT
jgi:hypothetical protein